VRAHRASLAAGRPSCRGTIGFAILLILFSGCTNSPRTAQHSPTAAKLFAVTADSAAFYRHGPQQGRDPDLKLAKDTIVKVIRPSFGYTKIQLLVSGLQGYVASEEIAPAPVTLLAAAEPPPAVRRAQERFGFNSTDPRLVSPPEQLPDPDLPPAPPDTSQ
jgi:hypothetical protein